MSFNSTVEIRGKKVIIRSHKKIEVRADGEIWVDNKPIAYICPLTGVAGKMSVMEIKRRT